MIRMERDRATEWRGERGASLCVVASGSGGNCSALRIGAEGASSVVLFDVGIPPRRLVPALARVGVALADVRAVVLTHFDTDHFQPGWIAALPVGARFWFHREHRAFAHAIGLTRRPCGVFEEPFAPDDTHDELAFSPMLADHDESGSSTFRVALPGGASLGYATDVGRVTDGLVNHLRAVDTLAIESNHCPRMQRVSRRPESLKQRIMGGAGHLSNQEAAEAVRRIEPRHSIALLHLSRECNDPLLAARAHAGFTGTITVARQDEPTSWLPLCPTPEARRVRVEPQAVQGRLFAGAPAGPSPG